MFTVMRLIARFACVAVALFAISSNMYAQVLPKPVQVPKQKFVVPKQIPGLQFVPIEVERILVVRTANSTSTDPGYYLYGGQSAHMQVVLAQSSTRDITVQLSYSDNPASYKLIGPQTVVVPAGMPFVEFDVTAPSFLPPSELPSGATSLSMSIKAWVLDTTQRKLALINLRPGNGTCAIPTPSLSAPLSVQTNGTITVNVGLSCKSTTPTTVQITSSNPGVIPPPPGNVVVIPAGLLNGSYTTTTGNVQQTTIVTISAIIPNTNPLVKAIDIQTAVLKP